MVCTDPKPKAAAAAAAGGRGGPAWACAAWAETAAGGAPSRGSHAHHAAHTVNAGTRLPVRSSPHSPSADLQTAARLPMSYSSAAEKTQPFCFRGVLHDLTTSGESTPPGASGDGGGCLLHAPCPSWCQPTFHHRHHFVGADAQHLINACQALCGQQMDGDDSHLMIGMTHSAWSAAEPCLTGGQLVGQHVDDGGGVHSAALGDLELINVGEQEGRERGGRRRAAGSLAGRAAAHRAHAAKMPAAKPAPAAPPGAMQLSCPGGYHA